MDHPVVQTSVGTEDRLRENVRALMVLHGWNQTAFAVRIGRSQGWVSKRLKGKLRFQVEDLDLFATVFGLSPAELVAVRYGKWERRGGSERRSGRDRRKDVCAADTPRAWADADDDIETSA